MYTHNKFYLLIQRIVLFLILIGLSTTGKSQVAANQCISLGNQVISSKVGLPSWGPTLPEALSDASDGTIFEVERPVLLDLVVDPQSSDKDLILHWRSASYESRGQNNNRGFHQIKIYSSDDGINWTSLKFHVWNNGTLEDKDIYESSWQDDYVLFENTHQQWIRVEELDDYNGNYNNDGYPDSAMQLSRLEVFTSAPDGFNDDIWLFMGNSETNGNMGVGSTNLGASTYFSNKIHDENPCYYPIVLNGGFGGEAGVTVIQEGYLSDILTKKPEISFVPFCYGLNDIMRGEPTPVLTPYGQSNLQAATKIFTDAYSQLIDIIQADPNRIAIPSRIPWVFVPNDYCPTCTDASPDFTYGTRPFNIGNGNPDFDFIDNIIQTKTPYAVDPNTDLAYADFDTWFYNHKYGYKVFREDKVHHESFGINQFNKIWVNTAEKIVYAPNIDIQITETDGTNDGVIDMGENVTLTASGGSQYTWSDNSTSSSIVVSPAYSQAFSVTITDGSGSCTYVRSVDIIVSCADYTISQSGLWDYPSTQIGTITIPNGKELILEDVALDFCQDGGIIIEDGGTLIIGKSVGLTSNQSWNGIQLQGQNSVLQSTSNAHWGDAGLLSSATVGIQSTTDLNTPITLDNFEFKNNDLSVELIGSEAILTGCKFVDDRGENAGIGIHATNSKLHVLPEKFNGTDTTKWKRSIFSNLKFGVLLDQDGQNKEAIITNSDFVLCGVGIHNQNVSGFKIRHNHFVFGNDYTPAGSGYFQRYQYGVLMSGVMPGFTLEGNYFDFNGNAYKRSIGIQVTQLGENENLIKGNHFEDMVFANVAFGTNGKPVEISGLQYACNKNHDNTVSIVTGNNTIIRARQGKTLGFGVFQSVDNQVLNGCDWDFYHQGNAVDYYYLSEMPVNFGGISIHNADIGPDCFLAQIPPGDGLTPAEKELNEKIYLENSDAYERAKDEWKAARQSHDEHLIKQKLDEMTKISEALWEIVSVGYLAARIDVQKGKREEVRKWIRRFNTFSGDVMLAADYSASEDWSSVNNTLRMIPQKYEMNESMMKDLDALVMIYDILATEPIDKLSSNALDDLDRMAESGIGYASYQARSIMSRYGYIYQPLAIDERIEQQFLEVRMEENSNESTTKLKTSPNPADYNVVFDWSEFVVESNKHVTIEIRNKMGSLIQILKPSTGVTSMEWTTEAVSSGLIYYHMMIDGQEVDSGQVIINK